MKHVQIIVAIDVSFTHRNICRHLGSCCWSSMNRKMPDGRVTGTQNVSFCDNSTVFFCTLTIATLLLDRTIAPNGLF